MLLLAVTASLFLLIGSASARTLGLALPLSTVGRMGFTFILGLTTCGLLLHTMAMLGVPIARSSVSVVLSAAVLLIMVKKRRGADELPRHPVSATVILAIPLLSLLFAAVVLPIRDYDGRVTWLPKARAIAISGSVTGQFFQGQQGLNLHNQYPLLLPLNAAAVMVVMDDVSNETARFIYPLIFAAAMFAARDLLTNRYGNSAAWVIAAAAWLPVFLRIEGGALAAYNDVFVMAAAGLIVLLLARPLLDARLIGFLAAGLIHAKNEGIVLVAAAVAAAIVTRSLCRMKDALPIAGGAGAGVSLLLIWRQSVPPAYDERYDLLVRLLAERLDRLPAAVTAYAERMIHLETWGVFWIAVGAALGIAMILRVRTAVYPATFLFLAAIPYAVALTVTSWNISELSAVASDRLLTHLTIPACAVITAALGEIPRSRPATAAIRNGVGGI